MNAIIFFIRISIIQTLKTSSKFRAQNGEAQNGEGCWRVA